MISKKTLLESKNPIVVSGTILFTRYAFSPNRLKYCGPDANLDLFEYASRNISDNGLVELLSEFEGAYPYLQFIANSNNLKDPFDYRVVEAYWIGNNLLKNVSLNKFYYHLKDRFGKRIPLKDFGNLTDKIPYGAKPYHAFHVFDIYKKMGGIRGIDLGPVLNTINNCKISWGKIIKIEKDFLKVEYQPLLLDKKLHFGQPETKRIDYKFKNKSFLENPKIGDWVSFHWNWACDILTKAQLNNLQKWTSWHLKIANTKN